MQFHTLRWFPRLIPVAVCPCRQPERSRLGQTGCRLSVVLIYSKSPDGDAPPGVSLLRYVWTAVARRPAVTVTAAQVRPVRPVLTAASLLFLARPLAAWSPPRDEQ